MLRFGEVNGWEDSVPAVPINYPTEFVFLSVERFSDVENPIRGAFVFCL